MHRLFLTACLCLMPGCVAAHRTMQPATMPVAQESLYENGWTWQTDKDKSMNLSELRGKPVVMAMFFTSCAGTCGVTVNHLVQLEATLNATERQQVSFVLVSFDSQNDTPVELARYRAERHLPAEWILLRGSADSTRELADQLAVKFAPDAARHILHGTQITVVDRNGSVVHRAVGTNADMDLVVASVRAELAGHALPMQGTPLQAICPQAEEKPCCCGK